MINAETIPVDVEEMRSWAEGHRKAHDLSWTDFAKASGIPSGTLSPFVTGKYNGDNERVARDMFKYRQLLTSQASLVASLPTDPGFFMTPSAKRIQVLLRIAHMGRITVAATGPGVGKTKIADNYVNSVSNAWLVTMSPSTRGVNNMAIEVLEALGEPNARGNPQMLSRAIRRHVKDKKGLLVIDEAQNLTEQALEELRSWHDATGVGVCLLGNEELLIRLEAGRRKDAFARLNSRIANRLIQNVPGADDAAAFCDAWGIVDPAQRKYLTAIATSSAQGGLRDCAMAIESASMIASDEGRGLTVQDLKDAQAQRYTRQLVA